MDYKEINRNSWNKRTEIHLESEFYDMKGFLEGKSSLKTIELDLLGDVSGLKILHLQCHFGQDSLSLARMGAKVTGVDLSNVAIENAKKLAKDLKLDANFICCDLYDLPQFLDEEFDLVFTSYGTIGWLPDLNKWAKLVNRFLKTTGKFVFVEFHPVVWMFDDAFEKIEYSYFNKEDIVTEEDSYAAMNNSTKESFVTWNHPLGDVLSSLIENSLILTKFSEMDYSPYNCFQNTIEFEDGKFRIKGLEEKIPMVYALVAEKSK